ncbi:MAG: hypothetical protein A3K10_18065 [Bacteroidetes bacterium RIFCSPLOWO2_12_FULL_31_6]|nr:MAG: hypothetical protein A3K10_18065 [Bacteroidetes bacterium RIFCSPLOWO2_12_FULL_31_6]
MTLVYCLLFFNNFVAFSQELNCNFQVNSTQVMGSDKSIFDVMQKNLSEFVNNKKWTNHNYQIQEKIECTMLINITERVSPNSFKATIQVQSRRPIFNSSYSSTLINHIDKDFEFTFNEFEQLEYSENTYISNLTSVVSFYVYMILAMDYESFSKDGGSPYLTKAQTIVSNAQNAGSSGWKAFEDTKNRYWLVENLLKPNYAPFRETMYNYHRLGFDVMSTDINKGRGVVLASLKSLESIFKYDMNSYQLQFFFNAKADEIVELFKEAPQAEKSEIVPILKKINPANSTTYEKIISGK